MNTKIQFANEGQLVPDDLDVPLEEKDFTFSAYSNSDDKILNFSGFIISHDNIFVSFPKHFQINKNKIIEDIRFLVDVINYHYKNNTQRYFDKTNNLDTNYPFNYFYDIYSYYKKYGLFVNRYNTVKPGYSGNVSWKDTIKKSNIIISNGNLIFNPLQIKEQNERINFISECMEYAINHTIRIFSPLLDLSKIPLRHSVRISKMSNEYIVNELYNLRNKVFKDIDKKLVSDLICFYKNLSGGGVYYLKHYSFSSVWECAVKHYLNYHFFKIDNDRLIFKDKLSNHKEFDKKPFHPNIANLEENIQPDYYYENGEEQFIFDAKYYNKIRGINYKQVAYYFFLKNYVKNSSSVPTRFYKTYNALILPGDKPQSIHFKFNPEYNYEESNFVIYECYLNVKRVLKCYLDNN